MTAREQYIKKSEGIRELLRDISGSLDAHAEDFAATDERYWAYVGDLGYVAELLNETARFLNQAGN